MKETIRSAFKRELPFFFSQPALIWQVLFFYLPILFIVFISFKTNDSHLFQDFTLNNYAHFFHWDFIHILSRSLILAFLTSIFCLCIGYPVAFYIARKADRWKNVMLFFLLLPFWTNMLVQVYAWFAVLEYKGLLNMMLLNSGIISKPLTLLNNTFAVYLVMIYYYLPFMIIPIYTVLEKLDDALIEASKDLGANSVQTFYRVILPLSMSGVMTGFFLVFVPAFGEFVIPSLMGGNKFMYVGNLISYYYLIARNDPMGAAFTVVSGLLLAGMAFVIYFIFKYVMVGQRGK